MFEIKKGTIDNVQKQSLYELYRLSAILSDYLLVSAEHDIFGEAVSDSEEDETNINIMELEDETSRPSADDSRLSDSASLQVSAFKDDSEQLT